MPPTFSDNEGEHYALFFISPEAIEGTFGEMLRARAVARSKGLRSTARQIDIAIDSLNRDLRQIERTMPAIADDRIRAKIKQSAKRPSASAGMSGGLSKNVKSEPLPSQPSIAGVGVARYADLDRTINPHSRSSKPYWRTQEYGYVGHVGRTMPGLFYGPRGGGGVPADPSQFRVHPIFRIVEGGPPMTIRRPIKARHFLRDGTREAEAIWRRRVRAAEARFVANVNRALAGQRVEAHPSRRRAPGTRDPLPPPRLRTRFPKLS